MQIGEGMVSRCYLQNGIVSKQYFTPFQKYTPRNIEIHWRNEIKALKLLKGKKHFPQLISVDEANRIIYMSYCGDPLTSENLPRDWEKQCNKIEETLYSFDIYLQDLTGKDNPYPPHIKNVLVKDGTIHIIDFGIWANKFSNGFHTIKGLIKQIANNRYTGFKYLSNNHKLL